MACLPYTGLGWWTMASPSAALGERRFALLLAVSQYVDPMLSRLRAPAVDAVALRDLLADPEVGGFDVTSVFDEKAHAMRLALEDFLADRRPDDVVLVYLSCHGLVDLRRRLYFAARDTLKNRLASSGVEAHWLLDQLEDCRARRQVVILDCCFSGAFAQGAKGDTDLGLGERLMGEGRGRVVLTASRGTEYSFEGEPLGDSPTEGSVFTSALVRGIATGEADVDSDGYISVDDAYSYAFERVRDTGAQQTPQRWLYGAEGSIVLARGPSTVGSTTHDPAEPPAVAPVDPTTVPPATTPSRPAEDLPRAVPSRRRRWWWLAAAAAALVTAVAIGSWALGRSGGGAGDGGGSVASSATSGQFRVEAPWRLGLNDQSGQGCEITVTDEQGAQSLSVEDAYGDRTYQMHASGTVSWETNDPLCELFQQSGAGEVSPPFEQECCVGDTPAFEAGDEVVAEITDLNGNPECELQLRAVEDGRLLDQGTGQRVGVSISLETSGTSPVYIGDSYCGFQVPR